MATSGAYVDNSQDEHGEPSISDELNHHDDLGYRITQVFRLFIEDHVHLKQLVPHMPFMNKIYVDLWEPGRSKKEKAELFMKHLQESPERGKYQAFVDALRNLDYNLVADVLEDKREHIDHENFKRLIQLFHERIAETISPETVSVKLQAREIISNDDADKIQRFEQNYGPQEAALYLLDTIPRRKENWYDVFLKILLEEGHHNLVKEIDDIFYNKNNSAEGSEDQGSEIEHSPVPVSLFPNEAQQYTGSNASDATNTSENSHSRHVSEQVEYDRAGEISGNKSEALASILKELGDLKSLMLRKHDDLNTKMDDMKMKIESLEKKMDKVLGKR